jgi:folate-binding protein YgfZ
LNACFHLQGTDTYHFLQGQMSHQLPAPDQSSCSYGLWLNANGRILADSHVFVQGSDSCLVWSYHCPSQTLLETMQRNLIADDVSIADMRDELACTILHLNVDKAAATAVNAHLSLDLPQVHTAIERESWIACKASPLHPDDFVFIGARNALQELHESLTAILGQIPMDSIGSPAYEFRRIQAGTAAIPVDLHQRHLPQEGRFAESVVNYRKGCFPGQEIMATFRKSGKISKQLQVVAIDTPASALDAPVEVRSGGLTVGTLTSVASELGEWVGMGVLRNKVIGNASSLTLPSGEAVRLLSYG